MNDEKYKNKMNETMLMRRILEVRYTDLEEERDLCRELLGYAEARQETYECAFANVYLFDSLLALGGYSECDFYLSRSTYLCRENGFEDLLLILCNLAGLYFLKLNDEQAALEYYLEGLEISERLGDQYMTGKLNNNIGLGFAGRDDWETARNFFRKAFEAQEAITQDTARELKVSYLCNLAESSIQLNELDELEEILTYCEELAGDIKYYQIRIGCSKISYYFKLGDIENCLKEAQKMLAMKIEEYENRFFVCDMMEGIAVTMIDIGDYDMAREFVHRLEGLMDDAALIMRYRTQCLKIRYLEKCEKGKELEDAYKNYYYLEKEMKIMDDQVKAQSILSRIQLANALQERERMKREQEELENVSHLDDLTGLYNRRYFNKLVSKAVQQKDIEYMGFIMLDIDYFKQYNDYYGHFMGDDALKETAKILSACAVEGISVSRYGGDEFVCLCLNLTEEKVDAYVRAIHEGIKARKIPHETSMCSDILSFSIGYCNGRVGEKKEADQMLQIADEALYEAKKAGRSRFCKKQW